MNCKIAKIKTALTITKTFRLVIVTGPMFQTYFGRMSGKLLAEAPRMARFPFSRIKPIIKAVMTT